MNIDSELIKLFSNVKFLALDFDGVLTDNLVYTSQAGEETVACWRSDGLGLKKIKDLGIPIWVISSEKNPVVKVRCDKLELNCIHNCSDKLMTLQAILSKENLNLEDASFIGNDINDVLCLEKVGLPIIVADSHPDIIKLGRYITKKTGGRGAVREVCDLIVKYNTNEL